MAPLASRRGLVRRAWWLGLAVALLGCLQVLGGWSARWHAHDGLERHVHWAPDGAGAWTPAEHRGAGLGLHRGTAEGETRALLVDEELSVRLPELLLASLAQAQPEVPPAVGNLALPVSLAQAALERSGPLCVRSALGPRGSAPPDRPGTGVERLIGRGRALRL